MNYCQIKKIKVDRAVKEAFSGFKAWWILLCSVSAAIFISQSWLPGYLFNTLIDLQKLHKLKVYFYTVKEKYISTGDPDSAIEQFKTVIIDIYNSPPMHNYLYLLMIKIILILSFLALFLCFLYMIIIIISKNPPKKTERIRDKLKNDFKKSYKFPLSYLILSIIKAGMLLAPFTVPILYFLIKILTTPPLLNHSDIYLHIIEFTAVLVLTVFLILLSVYCYIRFYFTGFIITEESANPFRAIITSWYLTRDQFSSLFAIFLLTIIIDIISVITVIGFIPGTGLKYTLRASGYRQSLEIKEEYHE
ncbi:MAG: hypothetical protein K9M56_04180 [Victivallales bacterium]|nr:hypothetical protein [Victivallales bacterium]